MADGQWSMDNPLATATDHAMQTQSLSERQIDEQKARAPAPKEIPRPIGRRRRYIARWLCCFVGAAALLALAELGARVAVAVTHRIPVFHSDARAGWANRPNLRREIRAGDGGQFIISTDAEGHRITRASDEPDPRDTRVLIVAGDSFCLGQSINDSETYAWILAHEMSRKVVNLGVFGHGTDQQLICLARFLEAHPDLDIGDIVVLVLDNEMTDVQLSYQGYIGRTKPWFRLTKGKLEEPPYRPSLSDRLMDVSYLYWILNGKRAFLMDRNPSIDPVRGIDVVVECLSTMREMAARRGARFHVIAHHYIGRPDPFAASAWSEFLQRASARDITPLLHCENDWELICYDGGHWSPKGHRLVAKILKEHLEAESRAARGGQ
jgi:hypothetical protein